MGPTRYRIEVAGELSARFTPTFEGMTLQCDRGRTLITGMVVDQSHLHGLLDRVGDLGLELVSVNTIGNDDHPDDHRGDTAGALPA